jgi:hypothetical protein
MLGAAVQDEVVHGGSLGWEVLDRMNKMDRMGNGI